MVSEKGEVLWIHLSFQHDPLFTGVARQMAEHTMKQIAGAQRFFRGCNIYDFTSLRGGIEQSKRSGNDHFSTLSGFQHFPHLRSGIRRVEHFNPSSFHQCGDIATACHAYFRPGTPINGYGLHPRVLPGQPLSVF